MKFSLAGGASYYFAFAGGLITGVLAPLSGGGTLMSESRLSGGQITPLLSASPLPSGAPFAVGSVSFPEGVQFCAALFPDGGGEFCAIAATLVSSRREIGVAICASIFIRS
jgi:hypothetical protein